MFFEKREVVATTVVFVSNYYNHHQAWVSRELDALTSQHYFFIETMEMEQERRAMGWGNDSRPEYVLRAYDPAQRQRCRQLIAQADAVIWGSCPYHMILPRLLRHKLTFTYSERLFKEGKSGFGFWGRAIKYGLFLRAPQKNHYLLCSSAYTAADHALLHQFQGRALRWGYFPQTVEQSLPALMAQKQPGTILWAGRMIGWKHPEYALETARRLKTAGCPFTMELVGTGALEQTLRAQVEAWDLQDCVRLTGAATPEQVRAKMDRAAIFLITSDQNEGWGAVLNESMNSGCAVVTCRATGAAPFLVEDGKNGLLFEKLDVDALVEKTRYLLEHPAQARQMGENACCTIMQTWNSHCAAARLIALIEALAAGRQPELPATGPCSPAPNLED